MAQAVVVPVSGRGASLVFSGEATPVADSDLQSHAGRGPMLSLRQPVTGTATGRRDKVQPVGDRPVPFSCGGAAMKRYRAGTWHCQSVRANCTASASTRLSVGSTDSRVMRLWK